MPVNKVGFDSIQSAGMRPGRPKEAEVQGTGFGKILKKSIQGVNEQMQEAAALSEGLISGRHSNIHETMIAMEKAGLSFRMLNKVQSKVIDAYKELMRLQL